MYIYIYIHTHIYIYDTYLFLCIQMLCAEVQRVFVLIWLLGDFWDFFRTASPAMWLTTVSTMTAKPAFLHLRNEDPKLWAADPMIFFEQPWFLPCNRVASKGQKRSFLLLLVLLHVSDGVLLFYHDNQNKWQMDVNGCKDWWSLGSDPTGPTPFQLTWWSVKIRLPWQQTCIE